MSNTMSNLFFNMDGFEKDYLTTVEIDITEQCNLNCKSCSRCCDLFPSNNHISIDKIYEFIEESILLNYPWQSIGILGGEPTLHPELNVIMDILYEYILSSNSDCKLWIMTNGVIDYKFPDYIEVIKNLDHSHHHAFYVSPIDEKLYGTNTRCESMCHCGIGYGMYGYTPCVLGSAQHRIFGYETIKSLKDVSLDKMLELCRQYCKHCGWYLVDSNDYNEGIIYSYDMNYKSKTWERIYKEYNKL